MLSSQSNSLRFEWIAILYVDSNAIDSEWIHRGTQTDLSTRQSFGSWTQVSSRPKQVRRSLCHFDEWSQVCVQQRKSKPLRSVHELELKIPRFQIVFESLGSIHFRNLTLVDSEVTSNDSRPKSFEKFSLRPEIYQVCVCSTGKLFMAKSSKPCAVNSIKDCNWKDIYSHKQ